MSGYAPLKMSNMTFPDFSIDDIFDRLLLREVQNGTVADDHTDSLDAHLAFVVEGVLLSIVSVIGIVGTSMSIHVLLKANLRESFSALLTALAVSDVLFLCFSLLIFGLPKLWPWFSLAIGNRITPISFGLLNVWRCCSTLLTLSVTLERYMAIVRPLTPFRKKRYLLPASIILSVAYNVPRFLELSCLELPNGDTAVVATRLRSDPIYIRYYMLSSKLICLELFPFITLVTLNALILYKVFRSSRFRRRFLSKEWTSSTQGYKSTATVTLPMNAVGKTNRASSSGRRGMSGPNLRLEPVTKPVHMIRRQRSKSVDSAQTRPLLPPRRPRARNSLPADMDSAHMVSRPSVDFRFGQTLSVKLRGVQRRQTPEQTRLLMPASVRKSEADALVTVATPSSSRGSIASFTARRTIVKTHHNTLGRTLLGVSVLYLTCHSLKIIPDLYEFIWCEDLAEHSDIKCATNSLIEMLISLSNLLMCINSAANFLMYTLRGAKFRRAFYQTYGSRSLEACRRLALNRSLHSAEMDSEQHIERANTVGAPRCLECFKH